MSKRKGAAAHPTTKRQRAGAAPTAAPPPAPAAAVATVAAVAPQPSQKKTELLAALAGSLNGVTAVAQLVYGLFLGPDEVLAYETKWAVSTGSGFAQFAWTSGVYPAWEQLEQDPDEVILPEAQPTCDFALDGRLWVDSGPVDIPLRMRLEMREPFISVFQPDGHGLAVFPPRYDLTDQPPDDDFGGFTITGRRSDDNFGVTTRGLRLTIQWGNLKRMRYTPSRARAFSPPP